MRFLKSIGKLYDAFSVHKKGQSPSPRTLPEATEKVKECKQILAEYENSVRTIEGCSEMTLMDPKVWFLLQPLGQSICYTGDWTE